MTSTPENEPLTWRKSSFSGSSNNCVEVAFSRAGHVAVRDSKNPHAAQLSFSATDWAAFTADARAGKFDSR